MSDQPTTRRIEFPITGDEETDFINGILAVLHPVGQDVLDSAVLRQRMRTRQRVCAYLEERFRWMADEADTQQRNIDNVRQSAAPIYTHGHTVK